MPLGQVAQNMAPTDTLANLLGHLASQPMAGAVLRNLAGMAVNGPVR